MHLRESSQHALDDLKRTRTVGWAFQAMERAFQFLIDDFQYRIGDAHLHQEGSYLSFVGHNATLVITYEEWWNGFSALLSTRDGGHENLLGRTLSTRPKGRLARARSQQEGVS